MQLMVLFLWILNARALRSDNTPPKDAGAAAERPAAPVPIKRSLDAAFRDSQSTQSLAAFRLELETFFLSPDQGIRDRALAWVSDHVEEISPSETIKLYERYVELAPDDRNSPGLRNSIALLRLRIAPLAERADVYRRAVRQGSVDIGHGVIVQRPAALRSAAAEGLTEFEPAIAQFAGEFNVPTAPGCVESRELLWQLRLSAGASDGVEAARITARRLEAMTDREFRDLMNEDAEFRQVVSGWAAYLCRPGRTDGLCAKLKSIYERQVAFGRQLTRPSEEARPTGAGSDGKQPDWLRMLYQWTLLEGRRLGMELE